ncbi:MAG TPA: prolipoprotein diacylglyceryl transferase family protein [Cyclobacteriaceae bacterium]|nr:prolipoprotein diacylglyceryl transferase family protein [Cyclobacteriaceae bacterium]
MNIPYQPIVGGRTINLHLILEFMAFFVAFRYYVFLRQKSDDPISRDNRLSIILGAAIGALFGSRIIAFLENPLITLTQEAVLQLLNAKTIMGGLFGGLLGVEIVKWRIKEKNSSGDLFTLPIIVGIFIGRIGCFLTGVNEFTYGKVTTSFAGMDLGDGLKRHPIALYELLFLIFIFFCLRKSANENKLVRGDLFKVFMLGYFGFRFFIEFIKPNVFFLLGLSSIQWLSIVCFLYYQKTVIKVLRNAYSKIHLL